MTTPPSSPKRLPTSVHKVHETHNTYKLEDFINKSDDFIDSSITGTVLVNYEVLINNFDLLKKVIYYN